MDFTGFHIFSSNSIQSLSLRPHPEGGFYRETYRSAATLPNGRPCSTSILFLLTTDNPSNLHRLDAEEVWFWQGGAALTVHVIHPDGRYEAVAVGPDVAAGEVLQFTVPPGVWFGSSVEPGGAADHALVGCVVTPGFYFDGFELADRAALLEAYPEHAAVITRLTRG